MTESRPNDAADPIAALREQVALGCRVLGAEDQGDLVWGHVSARDPDGRGVWMKASTYGFEEIGVEQVILVSRDGEVVAGEGRRHAEYPIHTEVMAARPDVGSVVHTHAPEAVALAATGHPLRPISHEATLFVPPQIARFTKTGDLILTAGLGRDVAAAIGERNALMLVNHGIVTVGPDVPTAVMTAVLLARACRLQLTAMSAGGWATWSDDAEALAKRGHCYPPELLAQAWAYLVRRLNAERDEIANRGERSSAG
jgi:ribulose-5-phosphate 4-epimerase/fuculose-1-phosphate aldolase